jgi:serine/threonine protein kinase
MIDHGSPTDPSTERFRILRSYAKGGLGEVFIANDRQLDRIVALKEIQKEHADNPIRQERFLVEARTTGKLEHPGIVPVYAMGTHADGRTYYAMRFIHGETLRQAITRFHAGPAPDYGGLEFRLFLSRFVDVCNTMAYAHNQGVLHRDLKPTNIMLGDYGETVVVDWGVAKNVGLTDTTESDSKSHEHSARRRTGPGSMTLDGQAIGSPAFMSPEQAGGKLDQLAPCSDVYSLGATLFVMLTDRAPFEGSDEKVLDKVKEGRFPKPRLVKSRVPRALEAICCKAMALRPDCRYQSALDLAHDIERWLADRPVSAFVEPWRDRMRRWVRRNQTIVSGLMAALVVGFLAFGTAIPLLSFAWREEAMARQEEHIQRAIAVGNEKRAAEERDRAQKALQFLVEAFRKPDPAGDGRALKVVDLLNQAAQKLEVTFADSPRLRATLLESIGQTYSGLGLVQESLAAFQRATTLRRETQGEQAPETFVAMNYLAAALQDAGRVDQAIPLFESIVARRSSVLGVDHTKTVESMNDLAVAYWQAGRPSDAIPIYQKVLEHMRVSLGEDHADTLTVTDNLAVAYTDAAQAEKAIPLHQAVLAKLRKTLTDDHPTTLITMNNLARSLEVSGRHTEAIALYETTLERIQPKLSRDHPHTLTLLHGLARAYFSEGQKERAIRLYEEVLARRKAKLGMEHPDTLKTTLALSKAQFETEHPEQAVPLAQEFLNQAERIKDRLPVSTRKEIRTAAELLIGHFKRIGRQDKAKEYIRLADPLDPHD